MIKNEVAREYDRLASKYDSRWARYVRSSTLATAVRVDLKPGMRLLDVGCGTGTLLSLLQDACPGIVTTGVDLSTEMLRVARSKTTGACSLVQAEAQTLPFSDGCFDAILSVSAFHYMHRPDRVLAEFRRVLKPQGQLVITDWCDDYVACKVCDRFLRVFNRAHRRIYTRSRCEELVRRARFDGVAIEKYRISWFWGLMTAVATKPAD